jgi:hypothetical protein
VLRLSKAGYADQVKTLVLAAAAESGYLEATMAPREAALTLADAAAGGTLAGKHGASVVFAAGSIVDAAGAAVSGPVQVAITPIDVGADVHSFPGRFEGLRQDGTSTLILSYGTVEFSLSADGQPVQLAPGRTATIEIPSYAGKHVRRKPRQGGRRHSPVVARRDDRRLGRGRERRRRRLGVVADRLRAARAGRPLQWWNADMFVAPPTGPPGRPKPKCMVDSNADGVLEDLTGTGYCWNAGTGPEQPESIFSASTGRKQAQASAGSAPRIPAWAGDAWIPAEGGVVLPVPAGLDITFRAYAKNGTLFGTKVVNIGNDVEVDVPILLEPVAQNPGTLSAALPYDERFSVSAIGETDRFTFSAEAGANYEVLVARNPSSLLSGGVRVVDANGAQLCVGQLRDGGLRDGGLRRFRRTMSVEVTATAEAPGSYRVQIRKILPSACGTPQTLTLPQTLPSEAVRRGRDGLLRPADAGGYAIRIGSSLSSGATGVLSLLDPDGVVAVSRGYGLPDRRVPARDGRRARRHLAGADPQHGERPDDAERPGLQPGRARWHARPRHLGKPFRPELRRQAAST